MAVRESRFATKDEVKRIDNTMAVVIFVLLIGFASMFVAVLSLVINADGEKHASYQDLRDQIQVQNNKIELLTKAIQDEQKAIQTPH